MLTPLPVNGSAQRRSRIAFLATLLGATLQLEGQTVLSGTYNGTIIPDSVIINPSTNATFTGGANFTGPNATFGTNAGLYWQQNDSLTGKALSFGSGSYLYVNTAGSTLTLTSSTTASGDVAIYSDGSAGTAINNQGVIAQTSTNTGQIYALNLTNDGSIAANAGGLYLGLSNASYLTTNSATGTITSNGSGTTIYLRGPVDNNGVITAQNSGQVMWQGTNTTANLGNVQLTTGGRALLNGTLDNTAANLTGPTGGAWELYGGTVQGGTIAAGALTFTNSGGYLDGATLTGDLALPNSAYVRFTGGANFTGVNANLGTNSGIYWQQAGTLTGDALNFGSGSYIYLNGVGNTLTLASSTTATGDVSIYSDGSAGTAITNQGVITHTSTNTGQIYALNLTNDGSITANAGALYLGISNASYLTTNSATGTITSNGSGTTVYLRGPVDNNGVITAQNSGQVMWQGTNTTANLGNVQLATGGHALLNGTIDNTAANLTAPTGGTWELYGGTVQGGTIAAGALTFTNSGGYLDGASLTGDLTLANSAYVRFTGGANFTGANATLGTNAGIYWQQTGTVTGQTFNFANSSYIYVSGVGNTLTLAPSAVATGDVAIYSDGSAGTAITNQGSITHTTTGTGSLYALSLTNDGSISATAGSLYVGISSPSYVTTNSATGTITSNGSGTTVYLRGPVDNNGVIAAQNSGQVMWQGTNTTANLGNVQLATGGHALLNGTIDNTAANLTAPTGGTWELYGGTIEGGTIAAGALTLTNSGGYLDGATWTGDLTLPNSAYVRFIGGANFSGANATIGSNAGIYWQQAGTLTGKALDFANSGYVYVAGAGSTLTLAPGTTATGDVAIYSDGSAGTAITNQGSITHTGSNTGSLYALNLTNDGSISATTGGLYIGSTSASYLTTNSATGTITSDGSGTAVYLRGSVDNNGVITAQNSGQVMWQGTNTTANLGNVQLTTGGRALFNGTIDNTAANLTAPTGGTWELYGGTVQGGTIAAGALSFTSSGGYLDGATLTGDLTIPASTYLRFIGGATFTGSNATWGSNAGLYWQQAGALTGQTLTFGSGAYLYVSGTNNTVALAPSSIATGSVSIYTDGSNGTAVTNQGIITNTTGTGQIYARTFNNDGSITASGGSTLYLGYPNVAYVSTNSATGSIVATGTGTQVVLRGPFTNNGLIQVQSGTVYTGNSLTNGLTGTVKGAGVLNGDISFSGGTLAPGNSIGALTQVSGSFVVTGNTVFQVELSGATVDQMLFQNPTTIDIGNGLTSLNLTLLGAPNIGTSYNIMQVTAGSATIAGTFAGLPNTGDLLTANYLSTTYLFRVDYLADRISLASIPEPGTYALMGLGLAALALVHRRRRRA